MNRLDTAVEIVERLNNCACSPVIHETQIILEVDEVRGVNFLSNECQNSVNFIFEDDGSIALQVYDEKWSNGDPRSCNAYFDRITVEQGIALAQAAFARLLRRTIHAHEED